ncbi:MAG TPA: CHAT domain-containing tetratricopeptide repeat protein [Candidatus Eisenbacteria bacterium]|nr:CHAT domain-containing tetratricopeptide repeat protein [Candidatus Eisenbacteria bacterium]
MTRIRRRGPPRLLLAIVLASGCGAILGASLARSALAFEAPSPDSADAPARATLEEIRVWNRIGRTSEAERAARSLLSEAERAHGPESIEAAEILDQLAVSLRRGPKALDREALEVCERALRIKERAYGTADVRFAASLQNLGLLHYRRQEPARALAVLNEALEIQESALGENDPELAKTLLGLGAVQSSLGNYAQARALTERGVAIEEIALGSANPERVMGLNSLASLRYSMGDFAGAIALFEEAIRLWERSPTPNELSLATCRHNLAGIYSEIGDLSRAVELMEQALRVRERDLGEKDPLVASTLLNLGSVLQDSGKRARAKEALLRAVRIYEGLNYRGADLSWALTKLGWLYLEEGAVARAEETLQRSLRTQETSDGPDLSGLWITLRGLAMVARKRGDTEAARLYYDRTVEILRKTSGPTHPDMGRTLVEYASFHLETGDSLAAIDKALQAAEMNREHLRLTATGIDERQALLFASDLDTGMDVALAAISGTLRFRSGDLVRRLWDAVVRGRALILDEVGGRARWVAGAGDLLLVSNRLDEARGRLAKLMIRGSSTATSEAELAAVARAREEVRDAERDLAKRSISFRIESERTAVGLDQVASALPPASALVSIACYGRGPGRSYMAFVAGPERTLGVVPLGSAGEMERLIARWRSLAGSPPNGGVREQKRAEAACRTAGLALRSRIWDPLLPMIGSARLVLVVPDGPLHLLNLSALPAPDSGYVVESLPVIHCLSAERDIVRAGRVHEHGTGLLAVGNPDFDRPERRPSATGSELSQLLPEREVPRASDTAYRDALASRGGFRSVRFKRLPETDREIDDISNSWGRSADVVTLKGDRAGERSVKELLPGRRVAHIATHGFFLDALSGKESDAGRPGERGIGGLSTGATGATGATPRPLNANPFHLSGLALAGANLRAKASPWEEDGILVAEEIASLDLSALDWVVLSACQTGLADVQLGEGVLGFRRAFEIAGAGTLIMSLWAVEDQAAREWMGHLYDGRMKRMLGTAEAVREANLAVLKSLRAQGRSTHPFFWAAFIAAGDWK